jgi:hypothetical protein
MLLKFLGLSKNSRPWGSSYKLAQIVMKEVDEELGMTHPE